MHNDHPHPIEPFSSRAPRSVRLGFALASALASTALLGGMLSLFETQSHDAALARAQPPASSASNVLAVRNLRPLGRT